VAELGGGIATEGLAITALKDYPGDVHVVIDAVAYSAASLIAMAGDTITFRLGATMMIHDPAMGYTEGGERKRITDPGGSVARAVGRICRGLRGARSGLSRDEVRQMMRDKTLDGPGALAKGLATLAETADVATNDGPAAAVARPVYDYRMYAHAPAALRTRSECLGESPGRQAILAMIRRHRHTQGASDG